MKKIILIFSLTACVQPIFAQEKYENNDPSTVIHKYSLDLENLVKGLSNSPFVDFDNINKGSEHFSAPSGLYVKKQDLLRLIQDENLLFKDGFAQNIRGEQTINGQSFKKEGMLKSDRYFKKVVLNGQSVPNGTILKIEETYTLSPNSGMPTEIKNHYFASFDGDKLIGIVNFQSVKVGNIMITGRGFDDQLSTERKIDNVISMKIAPVPASDKITVIVSNDNSKSASISIYDANSRLVRKTAITNSLYTEIDISSMPNGVYYLNYTSEKFEQSSQFVILK